MNLEPEHPMRKAEPTPASPNESSEQLIARLRRFVTLTRAEATRPSTVPFPDHVNVLAGPLRRRQLRGRRDASGGEHTHAADEDPLEAARTHGRRFSIEQYESPDNLAAAEIGDWIGIKDAPS